MIDKLIEGRLVTVIVGSVFRVVEILVRAVHITVRGVRILVQESVTSRIDAWISTFGKRRLARTARVDATSIVFVENSGEYDGDPKYIAEELLRRGAPYTLTWAVRDRSIGPFPGAFQFVRYGTARFFRAVAGARVVVHNGPALQVSGAVRGPSQHWIQTGREDRNAPGWSAASLIDQARNDILLDASAPTAAALRKKVLDRLAIAESGQRFLLYAPEREHLSGAAALSGIDLRALRAALSDTFGGTWELLVRTHDTDRTQSEILLAGLPAYCHNASFHPDLQELLVVADAGITDCADWIYDFLLTAKPAFLFSTGRLSPIRKASGAEEIQDAPLSRSNSSDELLRNITGFDPEVHRARLAQFLGQAADAAQGRAAARIVDRIEKLIAG